jgi:WD40-like Beta Propeller Repeat
MDKSLSARARGQAQGLALVVSLLGACAAPVTPGSPITEAAPTAAAASIAVTATVPSAPIAAPQVEAHPLAGLTFSTGAGFWLIDAQGVPQLVVDHSRAHLSPDGRRVVYQAPAVEEGADDIWIMDLANGERRNLTKTAYRFEEDPQWWPGRPDVVVFSSDVECCLASRALPTTVGLGGSDYQILDENNGGPRALSPDGQQMAYSAYQSTGWLYRVGGAPEAFNPAGYGLRVERLIQPAFSPDGRLLAWKVSGDFDKNGTSEMGIAVFDLQAKTAKLLHVYSSAAGGEVPQDIAWSPDGTWLAFVTFGEPPASGRIPNLWVVRPDGSEEKYLAAGSSPVWSPDSQRVAFLEATASGQPEPRLVDMTTFAVEPFSTAVPEGILFLLDWVRP